MAILSSTCRFMRPEDGRRIGLVTEEFSHRAFINSSTIFKIWNDILICVCDHTHFLLPVTPLWIISSLEYHRWNEMSQEGRWAHGKHSYKFQWTILCDFRLHLEGKDEMSFFLGLLLSQLTFSVLLGFFFFLVSYFKIIAKLIYKFRM